MGLGADGASATAPQSGKQRGRPPGAGLGADGASATRSGHGRAGVTAAVRR